MVIQMVGSENHVTIVGPFIVMSIILIPLYNDRNSSMEWCNRLSILTHYHNYSMCVTVNFLVECLL